MDGLIDGLFEEVFERVMKRLNWKKEMNRASLYTPQHEEKWSPGVQLSLVGALAQTESTSFSPPDDVGSSKAVATPQPINEACATSRGAARNGPWRVESGTDVVKHQRRKTWPRCPFWPPGQSNHIPSICHHRQGVSGVGELGSGLQLDLFSIPGSPRS